MLKSYEVAMSGTSDHVGNMEVARFKENFVFFMDRNNDYLQVLYWPTDCPALSSRVWL